MNGHVTCADPRRNDGGFSLIEVLFATLILFFVATALIGLAASTTVTAATAKQKNVMVNAVNSFFEQIKSYEYDDIGMLNPGSGEVPGILSDTTTMTVEGFVVVVKPEVTWVNDPNIVGTQDYKFLRIVVEATPAGGGNTISFVSETQVRNTAVGWGFGDSSTSTPPTIEFKSGSPTEMQTVSGTAVYVGATATHPMENGLLTNMYFYVGAQPLRNAAWGMAQFTINGSSHSQDFYWDTTALMDDNVTRISPDGIRTIKIEVWDNLGQQAYKVRRVMVDNQPPPAPGKARMAWTTNGVLGLEWDMVMDGTDPVWAYFVGVDEDQGTGAWVHTHERCGDNVQATTYEMPIIIGSYTQGFRRFRIRLYSESPLYMSAATNADPMVTPPALTGTWSITRTTSGADATCTGKNTLNWTAPKFPVSSFAYTLRRSLNADMSGATTVFTTTNKDTVTYVDTVPSPAKTGRKQDTFHDQYYYQLQATFMPSGPNPPSTARTVYSNVAGPNGTTSGTGTYTGEMTVTW